MPYGGFEKANQFLKFQLPDAEATKQEPEPAVVYQHDISCRPSFNRTPIGWVGSSEPSSIHMENDAVPFDAETDELWKNTVITLTMHIHAQAWMHAYMLACTHTIDELTINCYCKLKSLSVDNRKCKWIVVMFLSWSEISWKAKKQVVEVMWRWNIKWPYCKSIGRVLTLL